MKKIITEKAPSPIGPYSQAKMDSAGVLYISGQLGMDSNGELAKGIIAQTTLALENMGAILNAAGYEFSNVVKTTVLLSDMNTFEAMNSVYSLFFSDSEPARATYEVSRLPKNALVEIEAVVSR